MDTHDYAAALAAIPRRRDQLLPALHAAHHLAGWLPEAAIEAVGRHVFVPLSELYGIITSYSEFRLTAPDSARVEVCTGLTCLMAGAEQLIAALPDDTTIERVPCRFLCGVAPVLQHLGHYRGRRVLPMQAGARLQLRKERPPFITGSSGTLKFDAPSGLTDRRILAAERQQQELSLTRIMVGDGVCARAMSHWNDTEVTQQFARAAQEAGFRPKVVRTGCDGACYAQLVIADRHPDGKESRTEWGVEGQHDGDDVGSKSGVAYPGQTRRVLRHCGVIDPESLDEALVAGAYLGLERALALKPEDVVELVRASGLRGRGGAYFPTALKWDSARAFPGPRYVVVNAEEGEPGVFKDRHLMEGDPHALVEGTLIAAYAAGAEKAFIYINGQAELSAARVEKALADAREAGLVGEDILGSGFSCEIEIYRGAGGYVCGEESVILNSIEGERAVPRTRPPLPVEKGLWGRPTVINNVETLVNLPLILTNGADWFREVGSEQYPGTKLMSLSGALARPGLVEVPMGATIRDIIDQTGGGALPGHTITAAVVGGPSGGLMPAAMFDVPIAGGMLHPSGPVLGAGGIVVLDERTSVAFALRELTAYNKLESCGKCTPCREGSARALAILDRAPRAPTLSTAPARRDTSATGEGETLALSAEDRDELLLLCDVLQTASLCGLGQMAPGPIRSALTLFSAAE